MQVRRWLTSVSVGLTLALGGALVGAVSAPQAAAAVPGVATAPVGPALAARPDPAWMPPTGPVFNDPLGQPAQQKAILRRVIKAVQNAPAGSLIQIAVYSFDRGDLAYWLRKARKRGVNIQIIVNEAVMSGVARGLQKQLGANPNRRNFVVACPGACRKAGDGGNMHVKIFAFSQTGAASNVIISSSGNMTSKAIYRQWNDAFTIVNDAGLYSTWQTMFSQMAHQQRVGPRRINYTSPDGVYGAWFERSLADKGYASQGTTTVTPMASRYRPAMDPVVQRIRRIGCVAPEGYGNNGRTVVRIAAYAMFQVRGKALARALVRKKQEGCDIAIIMSVPGGGTYKMMERAGIPLRSGDWMFAERVAEKEDGISGWGPRFYSHYKFMAVTGMYNGVPTRTVWTGSENWSAISFANEEVVLTLNDANVHRAYSEQWRAMWHGKGTHRMGIEPEYGPGGKPAA